MNKGIVIAAAFAAPLLLVACGSGLQVRPSAEQYEVNLDKSAPGWRTHMGSADASQLAFDFCRDLGESSAGPALDDLAQDHADLPLPVVSAVALVGVATYCPEHVSEIRNFLEAQGLG